MEAQSWLLDETSSKLTHAALDAEIVFDPGTRLTDPQDDAPFDVTCRVADLRCQFIVRRVPYTIYIGPREQPSVAVWHCVHYNEISVYRGRETPLYRLAPTDPQAWEQVDKAIREGLLALTRLPSYRPPEMDAHPNHVARFVHCVGGLFDGAWSPRFFRGFGHPLWLPFSRQMDIFEEQLELARPSAPDWRFEDGPAPRLMHRSTRDCLVLEPDASIIDGTFHRVLRFRYDGRFGNYGFSVVVRTLYSSGSEPGTWTIDERMPSDIWNGRPREPGTDAENLPLQDRRFREEAILAALMHWPSCEATGSWPPWIAINPGAWGEAQPRIVGLNNRLTGLPPR